MPVLTLAEAVSVMIWVAVLFGLWIEYRYGITTFGAFFLPAILALGLGLPTGLRALALEPQSQSGWAVVHVALILVGLAALVLNFGSAIMYVLQERQIKAKRRGAFYYGLPALETLDHLTLVTLTVGFPFLTVGLLLGRPPGGALLGQPAGGRSAGALLAGHVAGLRGDAVGPRGRPVAGPPGRLLRDRRLLRAAGDARRRRPLPRAARLVIDTVFVAGLSHRTAPIEVREQLALEEDKLREVLSDIAGRGVCSELMILSTCNRVEVYGVAEVPGEAHGAAFRQMSAQRGLDFQALEPLLYTKTGADAVLHAFRVAASLDSMVLGEPQILGQVKDAFALAQSCRVVGPMLHALMSQAFAVAKRVRTETEIGPLAVSVSFAAVELARKIFGSLDGKTVLLIGAGEMGELAARHLQDQGTLPVYVANRTWGRAQELARDLAGTAVRYEDFPSVMAEVDIVITSTAAPEPIIGVADGRGGAAGASRASALLHRHRRAAERRAGRQRPRQRLLLRRRRSPLGRRVQPARAPAGSPAGRGARRARGRAGSPTVSETSRSCRPSCR